ncbi:gas vesicle protein [Pseudonocardia bannensis]|uniref:Gas vesicle protein n=1 Tax=Pseudonocardia bannensis TaxID=630973 RepID=A0A848DS16_9PSEU|nr:gas vesicle protein [Pseudonocardia bannensis]
MRSAGAAARLAAREVADLTGRTPEGIVSVQRSEDGWVVGIEVVEARRIPDSADILATYEAELDAHGELLSYRRTRRYSRGRLREE